MIEDGRPVLCTGVHTLAVLGGGVVHLVEEGEEGFVGEGSGVVGDLDGFGVWRAMLAGWLSASIYTKLERVVEETYGLFDQNKQPYN